MSLSTPVVLEIFNRPQFVERVLASIAEVQPRRLLVVADGPRSSEEAERCQAARAVLDRVDWDCDILTNFSPTNLGCQRRVSSGLDWVFAMVEEAIILEDDDIPDPTFFRFCEELLEKYRCDTRVMMINGTNFLPGQPRTSYSYYFSRYSSTWGWATWRRAWQHFDMGMRLWPALRETAWLQEVLGDNREAIAYWHDTFDRTYRNQIDTCAYRWKFALWSQNGLVAVPSVNLVSNIGCGPDATHTTNPNRLSANMPLSAMAFPLQHPPYMVRDAEADRVCFEVAYGRHSSQGRTLYRALRRRLTPLLTEALIRRVSQPLLKQSKT
jgi:hypothetical protein